LGSCCIQKAQEGCEKRMKLGYLLLSISFLALAASLIGAYHVDPAKVAEGGCNCLVNTPADKTCFCIDPGGCHFYCTAPGVGGNLNTLPSLLDIENVNDATLPASKNLQELEKMREAGTLDPNLEAILESYYEEIIEKNPDDFWAKWDYAQLKKSQGKYGDSESLYRDAAANLDPQTRAIVIENVKDELQDKWNKELKAKTGIDPGENTVYTPSPLSKFFTEVENTFDNIVNSHSSQGSTKDSEKLTWKGWLSKNAGICSNNANCNTCGTEQGNCVANTLIHG